MENASQKINAINEYVEAFEKAVENYDRRDGSKIKYFANIICRHANDNLAYFQACLQRDELAETILLFPIVNGEWKQLSREAFRRDGYGRYYWKNYYSRQEVFDFTAIKAMSEKSVSVADDVLGRLREFFSSVDAVEGVEKWNLLANGKQGICKSGIETVLSVISLNETWENEEVYKSKTLENVVVWMKNAKVRATEPA